MAQIRARALTPDFLEWLGQFLGDWRLGGGAYQVRRRPDGWLEVLAFDGPDRPLSAVMRGEHVRTVTGPPGPYPIVLTQLLIERWLTPQDREELRGAMHVSAGRAKLLERIEQRMRERGLDALPAAERADWATAALDALPIPAADERLIQHLWLQYRGETRHR